MKKDDVPVNITIANKVKDERVVITLDKLLAALEINETVEQLKKSQTN